MNRSNVGNVAANGLQVMAISAVNAKRILGRHDKTLNNSQAENKTVGDRPKLTEEQQKEYDQMQVDKKIEKIERHKQKTDDAFRRLSPEEQSSYREFQADNMRKAMKGEDDDSTDGVTSIDDLMSPVSSVNSEQSAELSQKIKNDIIWVTNRWGGLAAKSAKTGLFVSHKEKGVNTDADV